MKSDYQQSIKECENDIIRKKRILLFLSPFVIIEGYIFYIYYLKEGFTLTTFACLFLSLGMLLVTVTNFILIYNNRKMIKAYEKLLALEDD